MKKKGILIPRLGGSMSLFIDYMNSLPNEEFMILSRKSDLRSINALNPARSVCVMRSKSFFGQVLEIRRYFRNCDSIVVWEELTPLYQVYISGFLGRKRIIGFVHTNLSRVFELNLRPKLHKHIMKYIYNRIAKTVAVSSGVMDDLKCNLGINNVIEIKNGIDTNRVEREAEKFEYSIGSKYIVMVAAMEYAKNHAMAIRVFHKVRSIYPDIKLVLVGEGSLRDEIEKQIHELDLACSVILLGYKMNPYPIIKNAECMILTSRFEGYALVLAESLVLGVPVVSTNCESGPREIIGEDAGFLTKNEEEMTESVTKIISLGKSHFRFPIREAKTRVSIEPSSHKLREIIYENSDPA